ncbi:MAG: hypothetical protein CSA62_00540 [Planctomycetota bacterium]|nr:MAG: hypothetical protein CSA62_00540 [Planctomycetota bacterium]
MGLPRKLPDVQGPVRKILLPIDVSSDVDQTVEYATQVAAQLGAQLLFFSVLDSSTALKMIERHSSVKHAAAQADVVEGEEHENEGFRIKLLQEARRTLQNLVDRAADQDVDVLGHAVISEDAKNEILREARERKADLILLGIEEAPTLWKLFFSDTHDRLLQDAPCPVLTIRHLPWHRRR